MMRTLNFRRISLFVAIPFFMLAIATTASAQNIIVNGDFEAYSTYGQITAPSYTDYQRVNSNYGVDYGHYCIDETSGNNHGINNGWNVIQGNGKFMIVNGYGGSTNETKVVWGQNVDVTTQTTYSFSCRVVLLTKKPIIGNPSPAELLLKINGVPIGTKTVNLVNNQSTWITWNNLTWSSNNNTQATIEIYDTYNESHGSGDDFGLDDISFVPNVVYSVNAQDDHVTTVLCPGDYVDVNVLQNDNVLPNTNDAQVEVLTDPVPHGTTSVLSNKKIRYTFTDENYHGEVQFDYRVTLHGLQSQATVYVNTAQAPTITVNLPSTIDVCEGDPLELPNPTVASNGASITPSGWQVKVNGTWQNVNGNIIPSITTGHTKIRYNVTNQCGNDSFEATLNVHPIEEVTLPAVEECDEYSWHGTTYTQSGFYDYQTTTQYGCARTEHLPLTIHYSDTIDIPVSACEQYTWHGQTYTNSGTYTYPTTNEYGCYRLERLFLTISDRFRHVDNITECDSYYWSRTNQWYYQSTLDSVTVDGPQGGCDSTFVLNLTMHYADTLNLDPVEACDSYQWHGQTYTTSGVKTFETTNQYGCDRLERLNLTIHNSEYYELPAVTACDSYTWYGRIYTQSGQLVFDTVNQYGCNVQYTLPLTIHHSDTLDWEPVTECDSYLWYGQTITQTGNYTHISTNPEGCDRLERIYVTINYSTIDTLEPVSACDSYDWHGETYTQSGTYTYEGVGTTGCPQTEVLPLTINRSTQYEFNVTSCEPYEWFGTIYDEPGTYYHHLTNVQGCDSLMIMHLEMGSTYTQEENVVGCGSYEWNGHVYTESGDYSYEVQNPDGCDSLFVIHLTIAPTYEQEFEASSCYAYTWVDETYTQSGDYERHFSSQQNCDSLVTLHLTILDAVHHEFEQQTCGEFSWNGITYYDEGDYEQTFEAANGCDSIVTMHLVFREAMTSEFDRVSCTPIQWFEHVCNHNGDYEHTFQSVQGCDSIVTMHFSLSPEILMPPVDTLACEAFMWHNEHIITENGQWQHTFTTPAGCDSTVFLNVTFVQNQIVQEEVSACGEYTFHGQTYYPGTYQVYYDTSYYHNGCDSVVHCMNLTVTEAEQMGAISGSHEVYVSSSLISGIYRYDIDTEGIVGSVEWTLSNPDWAVLEATTSYCRILVATPGSATLTARFETATCGMMERHFDIHAGFFGLDESGVEVSIYPNPTKGTVTIETEGIRSVRLVNMMGQTLDWIETDRADHLTMNLNGFPPSVYLLEIDTVNGMVKRRVVVCR